MVSLLLSTYFRSFYGSQNQPAKQDQHVKKKLDFSELSFPESRDLVPISAEEEQALKSRAKTLKIPVPQFVSAPLNQSGFSGLVRCFSTKMIEETTLKIISILETYLNASLIPTVTGYLQAPYCSRGLTLGNFQETTFIKGYNRIYFINPENPLDFSQHMIIQEREDPQTQNSMIWLTLSNQHKLGIGTGLDNASLDLSQAGREITKKEEEKLQIERISMSGSTPYLSLDRKTQYDVLVPIPSGSPSFTAYREDWWVEQIDGSTRYFSKKVKIEGACDVRFHNSFL